MLKTKDRPAKAAEALRPYVRRAVEDPEHDLLAVPQGMRFSMRVAGPRSDGTRYVAKRLSRPQFAQYPAISPGISRL